MAGKAKKYTQEDLERMGYHTSRELRRLIRAELSRLRRRGDATDRLRTAMQRLRPALAFAQLIFEPSDVIYVDGRRPSYYSDELVLVWVAYLSWHQFGRRKSVVEAAHFARALLDCEDWALQYVPARHSERFVNDRAQHTKRLSGAPVLKAVPTGTRLLAIATKEKEQALNYS